MIIKNITTLSALALATVTSQAASISVASYTYDTNAESQPQSASFQEGVLQDVGNAKLVDGLFATGSWNDGTNVGHSNGTDNGNPQPRIFFDLGLSYDVATIEVWSVSAFLDEEETFAVSSSVDGITYSAPVTFAAATWTGAYTNSSLRSRSLDVSSLADGQFFRVDTFDDDQWVMTNEVQFDGVASVPEPSITALLGFGGLALILRRRRSPPYLLLA